MIKLLKKSKTIKKFFDKIFEILLTSPAFYDVFTDDSGKIVTVYNAALDIEATFTNVNENHAYYINKTINLYLYDKIEQEPDLIQFTSHKNEN